MALEVGCGVEEARRGSELRLLYCNEQGRALASDLDLSSSISSPERRPDADSPRERRCKVVTVMRIAELVLVIEAARQRCAGS